MKDLPELIYDKLEVLDKKHDELSLKVEGYHRSVEVQQEIKYRKVMVEIAKLKVKSGIWGMIGGAAAPLIGLLIWLIKSKI